MYNIYLNCCEKKKKENWHEEKRIDSIFWPRTMFKPHKYLEGQNTNENHCSSYYIRIIVKWSINGLKHKHKHTIQSRKWENDDDDDDDDDRGKRKKLGAKNANERKKEKTFESMTILPKKRKKKREERHRND